MTEAMLKRMLLRKGYALKKDRARTRSLHRQGGYTILEVNRGAVAAGEDFNLTLDDVESFLIGEYY